MLSVEPRVKASVANLQGIWFEILTARQAALTKRMRSEQYQIMCSHYDTVTLDLICTAVQSFQLVQLNGGRTQMPLFLFLTA